MHPLLEVSIGRRWQAGLVAAVTSGRGLRGSAAASQPFRVASRSSFPLLRFVRYLVLVVLIGLGPSRLTGQVPLFVVGSGGASFDVDDRDPVTGGGLGYLAGVGIRLPHLAFGAEVGQHSLGKDRKAKQYGAFVRYPAISGGQVRPYFVAGVADYRYSPAPGNKTSALGGSLGPGVMFTLLSSRASVLLEGRYHASFNRIGTISSQEFVSVTLGLELGL